MKNLHYEIGCRIRELRENRRYTREQLAELAGISAKFLYEIESGQKGFSAKTLYKLSLSLEVNSDYILFGELNINKTDEVFVLINLFNDRQKEKIVGILEALRDFI